MNNLLIIKETLEVLLKIAKEQRKVEFLVEIQLELMRKNQTLEEKFHKLLKNKNMIQENIEFIEEFERIQMIGQAKV